MTSFRYITDSPFRLLSIGSSTSLRELDQAAAVAQTDSNVSTGTDAGQSALFGCSELPGCANTVRSLTNDPELLTVYRLFWPFSLAASSQSCKTLSDFELLRDAQVNNEPFHSVQFEFLVRWFNFLISECADDMAEGLRLFSQLYNDNECDRYIASLLEADGVQPESSLNCVYESQKLAVGELLRQSCGVAESAWKQGDCERCISLVRNVMESGCHDDVIDRTVAEIIPTFKCEIDNLRAYNWSADSENPTLDSLEPLRRLILAFEGGLPQASDWRQNIDECDIRTATRMRYYAIDPVNDKSNHQQCMEILERIKRLPVPDDFLQEVEEYGARVEMVDQDRQTWDEILPLKSTPTPVTLNGCGLTLYGKSPFSGRPGWYFSTQYCVMIYIPIFPVKRFLVSDAPKGGWYFHGSANLTHGHKIHLWTALLAMAAFVIGMAVTSFR